VPVSLEDFADRDSGQSHEAAIDLGALGCNRPADHDELGFLGQVLIGQPLHRGRPQIGGKRDDQEEDEACD
jgi:hypothetical protein